MPTPGVVRVERRLDLTFRDALVGTHSVGAVANAVAPAERVAKAIGGGDRATSSSAVAGGNRPTSGTALSRTRGVPLTW